MISAIDRVKASSALTLINQRLGFRFRDTEREEGERERGRLSSPLSLGYNATVVGTVNSFADLTVFLFVRLDADLVSLSLSVPYRDLSTHCYEFRDEETVRTVPGSGRLERTCAPKNGGNKRIYL